MRIIKRVAAASAFGAIAALGLSNPAFADAATTLATGNVAADSGASVYKHVCQGCHMADGKGAAGAATIPALAGNKKLASSGYPVYVVLNGLGAMPWFNGVLTDAQIAGVVNYIRTDFGNHYTDPVSAADVAGSQGPAPQVER
jgi:mono/diheme cytochrome c family protein